MYRRPYLSNMRIISDALLEPEYGRWNTVPFSHER